MRRTLAWLAVVAATAACGSDPQLDQYGSTPELPEQQRGLLPSMTTPIRCGSVPIRSFRSLGAACFPA